MLVLTRKHQEKIRIGDHIVITVLKTKGKTVRLGIEAPTEVPVIRGELSFEGQAVEWQAGVEPTASRRRDRWPKPRTRTASASIGRRSRKRIVSRLTPVRHVGPRVSLQRVSREQVAQVSAESGRRNPVRCGPCSTAGQCRFKSRRQHAATCGVCAAGKVFQFGELLQQHAPHFQNALRMPMHVDVIGRHDDLRAELRHVVEPGAGE